jgi:hypothetical protein
VGNAGPARHGAGFEAVARGSSLRTQGKRRPAIRRARLRVANTESHNIVGAERDHRAGHRTGARPNVALKATGQRAICSPMDVVALLVIAFGAVTALFAAGWLLVVGRRPRMTTREMARQPARSGHR